jgi:hypothetical protein
VAGWCWVDAAFGQAEVLASVLASEGYRRCTITLLALLALYWYAAFELRGIELLLSSS